MFNKKPVENDSIKRENRFVIFYNKMHYYSNSLFLVGLAFALYFVVSYLAVGFFWIAAEYMFLGARNPNAADSISAIWMSLALATGYLYFNWNKYAPFFK